MKVRALVVEDEWAARNYLVELLEATGDAEIAGAVATAEDAREAIEAIVPGVVFVDIQLAGGESDGIAHVLELEGTASDAALLVGDDLRVPVARERAAAVRELLLANTAGVRRR
jgi:DNA-binding LytR/AlgR family response regulator